MSHESEKIEQFISQCDGLMASVSAFCLGQAEYEGLGVEAAKNSYQWPLPKDAETLVGKLDGNTIFQKTQSLKWKLHDRWLNDPENHLELAEWIVCTWGQVRHRNASTIRAHVAQLESSCMQTPFQGVSSYSKILSIINPKEYAVLDARVVVALHAIQILGGVKTGAVFRYIPGQNKVTGDTTKKRGFSQRPEFSGRNLIRDYGWLRVPGNQSYKFYTLLLKRVVNEMSGRVSLLDVEMALFSQAVELAQRTCTDLRK